ncbi:DNA repair protein RadC [Isoptericola sp. NPDC019482]|uniref:JAB domain-containing protein n=1 Tax=Isoptericola sp. NPDC019482 TaxID=3154688 RepID=UPI00349A5C34
MDGDHVYRRVAAIVFGVTLRPTITDLDAEQRPRERLVRHGSTALTDAELVALLLGSGRRGANAVDLAAELLHEHGGLAGLRHVDVAALARVPGVGTAKAARIVAALALTSRGARAEDERPVIRRSADVARVTAPAFVGARRERVALVVCRPGNRVLETIVVADGGAHGAAFPVREVLADVLRRDGVAFALAHNHPGGDPAPSDADRRTTAALRSAAEDVGLRLLDHLVVAGSEWRSVLNAT